jgi:hypothetical protein
MGLLGLLLEVVDGREGTDEHPVRFSTKSLPAYMKEPGEEEVVVIRYAVASFIPIVADKCAFLKGPSRHGDGSLVPNETTMPPVEENDTDDTGTTGDHSRTSIYPPEVQSPQDTPLLDSHDSHDPETDVTAQLPMRSDAGADRIRRSMETSSSSEGSSSLVRVASQQAGQDPRGEAPPYLEAISLNDSPIGMSNTRSLPSGNHQPSAQTTAPRLSGFRGFFHALNPRLILGLTRPPFPRKKIMYFLLHMPGSIP